MKKKLLYIVFIYQVVTISAQDTIPVLTLGILHFNFPNLDRVQIAEDGQIDVLHPKHQIEIINLVELLEKFEPTIIVIEKHPEMQNKIDSLYQLLCSDKAKKIIEEGEYVPRQEL